jgi:hypothetical protein
MICSLGLLGSLAQAQPAQPNQPIDRPYSLRLGEPLVLERQLGEALQAVQSPMSFMFPRPCVESESAHANGCALQHGFAFADTSAASVQGAQGRPSAALYLAPNLGYEWRTSEEQVHAVEGGLQALGHRGNLSFRLDARMTTEMHEDFDHASYDREFIEKQDEEASGTIAYTSYSRYRGDLNYDAAIGRFSAGRDTPHWGPALYNNLVFHRDAIPFHYLTYSTGVGPLRVMTLYGQLQGEDNRVSGRQAQSRSVYAHRYEWAFGADWVMGISEQLIVYSYEEPFAFLPILPLFIYKGGAYERLNNGNIAGDVNWRFAPWGRVYGEFLIDDIQSPTSLFDDNWGNKWAVLGGMQVTKAWVLPHTTRPTTFGVIAEIARLEPWVYTHYEPGTSQSLNRGHPLGNSIGPDAWTIDLSLMADQRADQKPWVLGMRLRLGEKGGTDAANVLGSPPLNNTQKHYLSGPVQEIRRMSVQGGYSFGALHVLGDLGYEKNADGESLVGWVGVRWL